MAQDVPGRVLRTFTGGRPLVSEDVPVLKRLRVASIWILALLAAALLLVAPLPFSGQVDLKVGDVAPKDVVAPRQVTYVSDSETQRRRDVSANAVPDVYDPPQARVARQQLALASQILSFINSVRSDTHSDPAARLRSLRAINGLDLPTPLAERILALPVPEWDRVATEAQSVLDRAMRAEIRESTLADERRKVPALVRLDLPDEDAAIVSYIVESLLTSNSFYNETKTVERRQAARAQVPPATATIEHNEVILRAGDIVTAADLEALNALGLRQAAWDWRGTGAAAALLLLLGLLLLYYLWREEPDFWLGPTPVVLLSAALLSFSIMAKLLVPAHAVLPYLVPYAALAMILAVLTNLRIALVAATMFTLLAGWLTTGNVELMAYCFAGSLVGAVKLRRGENLARFAWATAYVIVTNLLVLLVFQLADRNIDLRGLTELSVAALANGILVMAVSLLGTYLAGVAFGLTTPLQLMELSRPTHPLLRQLLLKAPGTYHHTLVVSNMAERAAEAIGADAQLARVGAYYHDVGKVIRPYFYAENRMEGPDPHTRLDPYTSAQIIIGHVRDGLDLARKYNVPARITDFIPEHHGTLTVTYFYHEAVKAASDPASVDCAAFTYPGPRPRSRETAITMLADGAEAVVRAKHPGSSDEIARIVNENIQLRVAAGQLDECPLTFSDLQAIQCAFVDVLRGIHHPRILYPADTTPAPEVVNVPGPAPTDAAPTPV